MHKIRILLHSEHVNLGQVAPLNIGIINSTKSDLIVFFDSDDRWHPNKIKE